MEPAGFDSHGQVGCSNNEENAVCRDSTKRHAEVLKNERLAMETLTRSAVAEPRSSGVVPRRVRRNNSNRP
jgi:hypothetical protein